MMKQIHSITDFYARAEQLCGTKKWQLGTFIAVFSKDLTDVLLVQLGDYARSCYDGNPWTLPGGAVMKGESPSSAVVRELQEETGMTIRPNDLKMVAWLERPYFIPRDCDRPGEVILLFAAVADSYTLLRPAPPETTAAQFFPFSFTDWMAVPELGQGQHPLQPLRKHWIYWAYLAQKRLQQPQANLIEWTYQSSEKMRLPPW